MDAHLIQERIIQEYIRSLFYEIASTIASRFDDFTIWTIVRISWKIELFKISRLEIGSFLCYTCRLEIPQYVLIWVINTCNISDNHTALLIK